MDAISPRKVASMGTYEYWKEQLNQGLNDKRRITSLQDQGMSLKGGDTVNEFGAFVDIAMLELCKKMEYMGNIGSSREIPLFVDGDGMGRLRFDCGNFKADIDKQKFQKELHKNGRTVEKIYIG